MVYSCEKTFKINSNLSINKAQTIDQAMAINLGITKARAMLINHMAIHPYQ